MTTFIGIDAFPAGWVAVYLEKKTHRFHYAATTDHLLDVSYQRAMIDIPIGLPQRGYRDCDLAARWNVWGFESYEAANAHYRIVKDTCISQQLWHLRHKLKEINETITSEIQNRLFESHPELVFWRLNRKQTLPIKKTPEGRLRRIELVEEYGISRIKEWLDQRHGTGIRRDDLIDACAC